MSNLERAIRIAVKVHKGQKDKYGAPYIGHVLRVSGAGRTEDEKIVGALHDVVEDSEWTYDDLRKAGFAEHIVQAVKALTKEDNDEKYDDFVERTRKNKLAIRVKLNDLQDNMDVRRIPAEVGEKDVKRLNKYLRAWRILIKDFDED
jgi:(p)ppGpp synthase/HD superfamily hydrolase